MAEIPLPRPSANQVTIELSRLSGGYLHLPSRLFLQDADPDTAPLCPSMCWLIVHPPTNTKLMFDLGLRKDIQNYTPGVHHRLQTVISTVVEADVFDSLAAGHLTDEISTVIFSHLHYDHVGDPSRFGPPTNFLVGPGTLGLLNGPESYPANPHSHLDSSLLPRGRTTELPPFEIDGDYWQPIGPFPAARDYFGDSSLFIVDAPGHMTGHINLLVRTGPEEWTYLGGDTAHDFRLLTGERSVAVYLDEETGLMKCAHMDKEAAQLHIERVRKLAQYPGVEVILAHDHAWFHRNKERYKLKSGLERSKSSVKFTDHE